MEEYIRKNVPYEELMAQLAEEATELAHAALKLRRAYTGTNPTPVNLADALVKLEEEIADVQLVLEVLGMGGYGRYAYIREKKLERWADRLKAARQEDAPCTK